LFDVLQGDSGGPLVVQAADDKLEIVGKSNEQMNYRIKKKILDFNISKQETENHY
jgi:hypothetical protein